MKWLKWIVAILSLLLVTVVISVYALLYLSLGQYEGAKSTSVKNTTLLERDAQGYLTVQAQNRNDAAFALGFTHAQERFFQMDLLRKNAAGELSQLFGKRALEADISLRQHRFRARAKEALTYFEEDEIQLLNSYTQGVNEGLNALTVKPFEYWLLGVTPTNWQNTDSLLVIYSMYLDLQGKLGKDDYAMTILKEQLAPNWYAFLQQHSDIWQSAIDGSVIPSVSLPDTPYPAALQKSLHACVACSVKDATDIGSNNFAVSGSISVHGGAILADDMHLGIRVPGTWFKAQVNWKDGEKTHQVTGLSLPGTPAIVVGSNKHIAWGFTNSTADWHDLVSLQLSEDKKHYLTADGWKEITNIEEVIDIAKAEPHVINIEHTIWGPIVYFGNNQPYALRWTAYESDAVNFKLMALETRQSAEEAVALAPNAGIPTQNLVVADKQGNIAWALMGKIPKRNLPDLDTAQDWTSKEHGWFGYIDNKQQPSVINPTSNRLWTANSRMIGHEHYELIGNGGYDLGARAKQIEQGLFSHEKIDEKALHDIQLDNRALMLSPWQTLLLSILTDDIVDKHQLHEYKQHVMQSSHAATTNAIGYSLVRAFRQQVLELQFAPLSALLEEYGAKSQDLKFSLETPLWQMLQQKRPDTLAFGYQSWDDLLLSAVLQSKNKLLQENVTLDKSRWGLLNQAKIAHPLSSAIPFLGQYLNMPSTELSGDSHMPRVQRASFGQSQRLVVSPGHEHLGILTIPAGQSGHPLSPFYQKDHHFWLNEIALPFLPMEKKYELRLEPRA